MDRTYLTLCDFSYEKYRTHEDLKKMSDAELENHFFEFGIKEGRVFNYIDGRQSFMDIIECKGKMLEIGPLDKPQLDFESPEYYSVDVFTKEQLASNYIDDPNVNKDKLIEPSYVIANNDYSVISEKFDCIFSSHSIEHMPCLITFLNNLGSVLSNEGYIYLAIPDKRYCFDYFKKETDIYDVLQLYYEKNYRPRLMDILKMISQVTHNDSHAHWNNDHGTVNPRSTLVHSYEYVLNQYNSGMYIDSHVSFFTPENFLEILQFLNALNLINVEICKIFHTLRGSHEFYAVLKKRYK